MKVSIIIVTYQSEHEIENCLNSIYDKVKGISFEIIIIDNSSTDSTKNILKNHFENIILIENKENLGYSVANNQGAKLASGDFLFFLNPDSIMTENSLKILISIFQKKLNVGIAAPRITDSNNDVQISTGGNPNFFTTLYELFGLYLFLPKKLFGYRHINFDKEDNIINGWVSGSCFLIKKDIFMILKGFDENFFLYLEDTDLCLRLRSSFDMNILYTSKTSVIHLSGKSSSGDSFLSKLSSYRSKLYFHKKHNNYIVYFILIPLSYIAIILKLMVLILLRKSKEEIMSQCRVLFHLV